MTARIYGLARFAERDDWLAKPSGAAAPAAHRGGQHHCTLAVPGCVIRSNAIAIFDVELVDVKG